MEPQDLAWLRSELSDATHRQIYEEISAIEAHRLNRQGFPISNAFIVRTEKRRLVVNLKRQSGLFRSVPVKMETLESFALEIKPNNHLLSFDIEKGYHHFRLYPAIHNWFLFRIDGRYFRCTELPFEWKLSPFYFIKFMRPFVEYVRNHLNLRIHPYRDDLLVATSSPTELKRAQRTLDGLLRKTGLRRKPEKGCWEGSQRLEHLGFVIDTKAQVFGITDKRVQKIQNVARKLLQQARQNRRLVETSLLRHFLGVAISCSLPMPLARFYTRSLYDSLQSQAKRRVKLKHAAIRDLVHWKKPGQITVYTPSPSPNGYNGNALRCINLDWHGGNVGTRPQNGGTGGLGSQGTLGSSPTDEAYHLPGTTGGNGQSESLRRGPSVRHPSSGLGGQSSSGPHPQHDDHPFSSSDEGVTSVTSRDAQAGDLNRISIRPFCSQPFRRSPLSLTLSGRLEDQHPGNQGALIRDGTNDRPFRGSRVNDLPAVQQPVPITGVIRNRLVTVKLGANVQLLEPAAQTPPIRRGEDHSGIRNGSTGHAMVARTVVVSSPQGDRNGSVVPRPDVYLPPLWAPKHMSVPPWKIAVWTIRNSSH